MPSVCKKHMRNKSLVENVAKDYRTTMDTVEVIAERNGVNTVTARAMIRRIIPDDKFRMLKRLRYRTSRLGKLNPNFGKVHPKQDCGDGRGYLTRLVSGKRHFVHRIVFAEMLGIRPEDLPESIVIHHIDGDRKNNHPDNLAAVTNAGHKMIHELNKQTPEDLVLKKLNLQECIQYMTSG